VLGADRLAVGHDHGDLEAPTGRRFLSRARVFTADELAALGEAPPEAPPMVCALPADAPFTGTE